MTSEATSLFILPNWDHKTSLYSLSTGVSSINVPLVVAHVAIFRHAQVVVVFQLMDYIYNVK